MHLLTRPGQQSGHDGQATSTTPCSSFPSSLSLSSVGGGVRCHGRSEKRRKMARSTRLHEEREAQVFELLALLDLEHREHRNVRCTALDGRVDRGAQRVRLGHAVAGHCVWEVTPPPEDGIHLRQR